MPRVLTPQPAADVILREIKDQPLPLEERAPVPISDDDVVEAVGPAAPAPSAPEADLPVAPAVPRAIPIEYLRHGAARRYRVEDFLFFRSMIAIPVILGLFWVGVFLCVAGGLAMVVDTTYQPYRWHDALKGLALAVLGPLLLRVACEFLIVVFRLYERLTEIRDALEKDRR